ncbi:hypothetical protein ACR6C2_25990 [Streptomyces sp. INA 01156]
MAVDQRPEGAVRGENFKHNTVPYFTELTTSVHLLKTEVVSVQTKDGEARTEIGRTGTT